MTCFGADFNIRSVCKWCPQTFAIVIGIVCGALHLLSLILHLTTIPAVSILGVFCGGCLVMTHFWKEKHLYWPFLVFNALDFISCGIMLMVVTYVMAIGSAEIQIKVCNILAKSFGSEFAIDKHGARYQLLVWFVLLIATLAFDGLFEYVVLKAYNKKCESGEKTLSLNYRLPTHSLAHLDQSLIRNAGSSDDIPLTGE
ncbi:hypothetical protein DdX_15376 [Ditylenchus destructor]|uniref:Uncharacterized protein n=1 Tax=Ditylenchus destructor TaxID=166010 RepID=A0AAD4R0Y9_9BILA|nr:hypothetical protein DdX_15376 [Ditylenchus destructor]